MGETEVTKSMLLITNKRDDLLSVEITGNDIIPHKSYDFNE